MKEVKQGEEIPQWVIEYNAANHQSSAGKAIRILMTELQSLRDQLKSSEYTVEKYTDANNDLQNQLKQRGEECEELKEIVAEKYEVEFTEKAKDALRNTAAGNLSVVVKKQDNEIKELRGQLKQREQEFKEIKEKLKS